MRYSTTGFMLACLALFTCTHPTNSADLDEPEITKTRKKSSFVPPDATFVHQQFRYYEPGGNSRGDGQCGNRLDQNVLLGNWSAPIRIDTDRRWGGCTLAWGIIDPLDQLKGAKIEINFQYGDGIRSGECGGTLGRQEIPISKSTTRLPGGHHVISVTNPIFIDTDFRKTPCELTFIVSSGGDIQLHVQFYPDDIGVDQCKNQLPPGQFHIAKLGQSVRIGFATNNDPGGCQFLFRLIKG